MASDGVVYQGEPIELPSKGLLYPKESVLSSGTIDVKYMTAREEDILTSSNLLSRGTDTILEKLLESVILTKGVDLDQLLIGDISAIIVAARILAYGKMYRAVVNCGDCGHQFAHDIDLSELEMIPPPEGATVNDFPFTLPSGTNITYKYLTRRDEKEIKKEIEALKKVDALIERTETTKLKFMITSVNGDRKQSTIRQFVDTMRIKDSGVLKRHIRETMPGVDLNITTRCPRCDTYRTGGMPIGSDFFQPETQ